MLKMQSMQFSLLQYEGKMRGVFKFILIARKLLFFQGNFFENYFIEIF